MKLIIRNLIILAVLLAIANLVIWQIIYKRDQRECVDKCSQLEIRKEVWDKYGKRMIHPQKECLIKCK